MTLWFCWAASFLRGAICTVYGRCHGSHLEHDGLPTSWKFIFVPLSTDLSRCAKSVSGKSETPLMWHLRFACLASVGLVKGGPRLLLSPSCLHSAALSLPQRTDKTDRHRFCLGRALTLLRNKRYIPYIFHKICSDSLLSIRDFISEYGQCSILRARTCEFGLLMQLSRSYLCFVLETQI